TGGSDTGGTADPAGSADTGSTGGTASGTGGDAAATDGASDVPVVDRSIPPSEYKCPTGMARVHRRKKIKEDGKSITHYQVFCVDRREYPGYGKPRTEVSFYGAKQACARKGKRLCGGSEWRTSCGGRKYPYGKTYDSIMCNTMSMAGEERPVVASGYYRRCRSAWGVFDLVGNVGEWTADGNVRGGDSYRTADLATCGFSRRRSPGSKSRLVGFRCCADADLREKEQAPSSEEGK
ncbi:MAG: hypothetical protein ACI9WU_002493, partial [Myxococcota bacterium]